MENLHIFITNNLAEEFTKQIVRFSSATNGPWSFFASGGSLAPELYQELAANSDFWPSASRMSVYLGDERVTDPALETSNIFSVMNSLINPLLSHSAVPTVFPPFTKAQLQQLSASSQVISANDYERFQTLADAYSDQIAVSPKPWLIHLGIGSDGHTASLFPFSPALGEAGLGKEYLANYDPNGLNPYARLTLSLETIGKAELVIITTRGKDKAAAIKGLLEGDTQTPVSRIKAAHVNLIIDYEAASLVEE
ncbi:MAG: hypothetical protein HKL84_01935 [Acidimicrobiaceae bacterium]|nr:hypothetical protein [Acidimicrobiaceae bacterium]